MRERKARCLLLQCCSERETGALLKGTVLLLPARAAGWGAQLPETTHTHTRFIFSRLSCCWVAGAWGILLSLLGIQSLHELSLPQAAEGLMGNRNPLPSAKHSIPWTRSVEKSHCSTSHPTLPLFSSGLGLSAFSWFIWSFEFLLVVLGFIVLARWL